MKKSSDQVASLGQTGGESTSLDIRAIEPQPQARVEVEAVEPVSNSAAEVNDRIVVPSDLMGSNLA